MAHPAAPAVLLPPVAPAPVVPNGDGAGEVIYILQLRNGKYYVGRTQNLERRFRQHLAGVGGSAWTHLHSPVAILSQRPALSEHDEENATIDAMRQYGIANVRGSDYCQVKLRPSTLEHLRTRIAGATNACYLCMQTDHFAAACPQRGDNVRDDDGDDDGDDGNGYDSGSGYGCSSSDDDDGGDGGGRGRGGLQCFRCGHTSHFIANCTAIWHKDGTRLDSRGTSRKRHRKAQDDDW
jgi:cellular nucleic acid-binding protein